MKTFAGVSTIFILKNTLHYLEFITWSWGPIITAHISLAALLSCMIPISGLFIRGRKFYYLSKEWGCIPASDKKPSDRCSLRAALDDASGWLLLLRKCFEGSKSGNYIYIGNYTKYTTKIIMLSNTAKKFRKHEGGMDGVPRLVHAADNVTSDGFAGRCRCGGGGGFRMASAASHALVTMLSVRMMCSKNRQRGATVQIPWRNQALQARFMGRWGPVKLRIRQKPSNTK